MTWGHEDMQGSPQLRIASTYAIETVYFSCQLKPT